MNIELKQENKMSQNKAILNHLLSGKTISQLEATQQYGVLRLGAIIFNLRKDGHIISTEQVCKPNRYGNISHFAIYKLIKQKEGA